MRLSSSNGVGAELAGPQPVLAVPGQALHVAVAVGPDGGAAEGVAGSGLALGREPQDLAAERAEVLREGPVAGLAGADVEVAVGAEGDAAAVVVAPHRDAVEDHLRLAEGAVAPRHGRDAVVVVGGVVGVEDGVGVEVLGHRQPEQAALPGHAGDRERAGDRGAAAGPRLGHVVHLAGVAHADERAAVGQHRDRPRHVEAAEQRDGRCRRVGGGGGASATWSGSAGRRRGAGAAAGPAGRRRRAGRSSVAAGDCAVG